MRKNNPLRRIAVLVTLLCFALSVPCASAAAPPRTSANGMVVSTYPVATCVGEEVLQQGGNAIDAAVAVGFALAVVHPAAGNIGGGGFAVFRLADGTLTTLDFRETAPKSAYASMYLESDGEVTPRASTVGYRAAGVPGTVAGLCALLERHGTMPLADLVEPAIRLARDGFTVSARQEETFAEAADLLAQFPSSRGYFLKPDGSPYRRGERLVQRDLAKSLCLIAQTGADAFYRGPLAELLVADMERNGGLITREDLAGYSPVWREPVRGTYRGYEIVSMGPPSSGGTHILQILNIMERDNIGEMGFGSSRTIHRMAEAMRQAFADRSEYMGDPDFVPVPVKKFIDKEYAHRIHRRIVAADGRAIPSEQVRPGAALREPDQTTHYSVMDRHGNAVAVTYTINGSYGSGAAVAGAGFLLNNQMDDFAVKPGVANLYGLTGSDANAIAPGKRPLSSMSPTLVLRDGEPFLVVGSPGGSRIITTVVQVISNVIDHGMTLNQAVAAPRFHMQWQPDELRVEPHGMARDVAGRLEEMGYTVVERPHMGDVNAIQADHGLTMFYGAGDFREEF